MYDGSTSDVQGIPHIAIGTSGSAGLNDVAARIAGAVNATAALDISAVAAQNRVTLTQGSSRYSGNTNIKTAGVHGVTTPPFVGGTQIGIRSVLNDRDGIAGRVAAAITGISPPPPAPPQDGLVGHYDFNQQGNPGADRSGANNALEIRNGANGLLRGLQMVV